MKHYSIFFLLATLAAPVLAIVLIGPVPVTGTRVTINNGPGDLRGLATYADWSVLRLQFSERIATTFERVIRTVPHTSRARVWCAEACEEADRRAAERDREEGRRGAVEEEVIFGLLFATRLHATTVGIL